MFFDLVDLVEEVGDRPEVTMQAFLALSVLSPSNSLVLSKPTVYRLTLVATAENSEPYECHATVVIGGGPGESKILGIEPLNLSLTHRLWDDWAHAAEKG